LPAAASPAHQLGFAPSAQCCLTRTDAPLTD